MFSQKVNISVHRVNLVKRYKASRTFAPIGKSTTGNWYRNSFYSAGLFRIKKRPCELDFGKGFEHLGYGDIVQVLPSLT